MRNRAILHDITEFGLNPNKPHTIAGTDGRLFKATEVVEHVVHEAPEPEPEKPEEKSAEPKNALVDVSHETKETEDKVETETEPKKVVEKPAKKSKKTDVD